MSRKSTIITEEEMEGEYAEEPKEEKEMLFLIEFLVDTLQIYMDNLELGNVDPCQLQGQTCLCLSFLHFPPMNICEKDLDPDRMTGCDEIKFNSGKSLMFALADSQFENPPPIYLNISALKQLPHGSNPATIMVGMAKICLSDLFKLVFEKVEDCPEKVPFSKSIKDTYQLMTDKNKVAADMALYVRLTCLGQNIVTEFQRGEEEDPYLFKSRDSNKIYECKPKDLGDDSCDALCPPCPGWGKTVGDKNCGKKGCQGGGDDESSDGCGSQSKRKSQFNADDYEEFNCEVNGHSLTVRIQKSDRTKKKEKSLKDEIAGIPPPVMINPDEFCDCDIPLPSQIPPLAPEPQGQPSGIPAGGVGKDGNQIVFQIPPNQNLCKKGDHNAVVYNVSTCEDGPSHGHKDRSNFRIVPEAENMGKGSTSATLPNDPTNDVFVLRIGKKGASDGNGKLELELRTPKEKIEEPPKLPYMIDQEIQTDKAKGKGKGKGKKK